MSNSLNFRTLLEQYTSVEIPIIQRDYAQGRKVGKAPKIREEFIKEIYNFLTNKSLTKFHLDFIYGIVKDNKFIPLDGQQRLTTLFLLYWYAGKKEGQEMSYLKKFTYETRVSSKEFCEFLVDLSYDFSETPSKYIKNQNQFVSYWGKDPTIQSMLVMLDTIDEYFNTEENMLNRLNYIEFSFPDAEIELSEDTYIKMNSRGKELTAFENFKAKFEALLDAYDVEKSHEFSNKIDNEWCDFFWAYREDNDISKPFLRFFIYISEMLYFEFCSSSKLERSPFEGITTTELEKNGKKIIRFYKLIDKVYFNKDINKAEKTREILFSTLNKMSMLQRVGLENFFGSLFYTSKSYQAKDELYKINLFTNGEVDHLFRIVHTDVSSPFSFKLLFYSVIRSGFNEELKTTYRVIRNLVVNDDNNMRADYMRQHIKIINLFLSFKEIADNENVKFLNYHLEEELFKTKLILAFPQYENIFVELENHDYFWGSIRAVFNILFNKHTDSFIPHDRLLTSDCSKEIKQAFLDIITLSGSEGIESLWGELITSDKLYIHQANRLMLIARGKLYNTDYGISCYIPLICEFRETDFTTKEEFLLNRCKNFIKENTPLSDIDSPQEQIYVMYLVSKYIHKISCGEFFKHENYQFGIYGEHDELTAEQYVKEMIKQSPFAYKTAVQLFKTHWRGGQAFLAQPEQKELTALESL